MEGTFRETAPPERLAATERFDEARYPREAPVTTSFLEEDEITKVTITITILYQSKEARDTAGRSGMEHGTAASSNRLEELLTVTR